MKALLVLTLIFCNIILYSDNVLDFPSASQDSSLIIYNKMKKAIGSVDWIESIKTEGMITQPVENGFLSFDISVLATFPNKIKLVFQGNEYVVENKKGWQKYPKGYFENLSEHMIAVLMGNLKRNLIFITCSKNNYRVEYDGKICKKGKDCYILTFDDQEIRFRLLIDAETYLPHWMEYYKEGSAPLEKIIKAYLDYELYNGINCPVKTRSIDERGNLISEVKIEKIRFNLND